MTLPRPAQAALVIATLACGLAAQSADADIYLCHFVQNWDDDGLYEDKHPFLLTLSPDGHARMTEHRNISRRDGTATSFQGACQHIER